MSKLRDILISEGLMSKSAEGRTLPTMRDLKQVKMVVIGPKGRHREVLLTREGQEVFGEITNGDHFDSWSTPRHHPALIWIAQNRPELFDGGFQLLPVPGGKYLVKEYNSEGRYTESLQTPETMDWIQI